jgi:hypothetical protein
MKTTSILLGMALFLLVTVGCKKEDKREQLFLQNPFTTTLPGGMENYEMTIRTSGAWELGIAFRSNVSGKITQLGVKMPVAGRYVLSLWDAETRTQIRTKTVEQDAPDKLRLVEIDPVDLPALKKMIVSVNSLDLNTSAYKNYFCLIHREGTNFMPYTQKDIEVLYTCYTLSDVPVFPGQVTLVEYEIYGRPEISFVPN